MKNLTAKTSTAWQSYLIIALGTICVMMPDIAFAGSYLGWSPVGAGLCILAQAFQGQVAAAVATIAVCTIGVMACLGRVQWTTAILAGVGISCVFGAGALVGIGTGWIGILPTSEVNCENSNVSWYGR